jgi:glycosyltransferase involved in cell wall biosynthesis
VEAIDPGSSGADAGLPPSYREACRLAEQGRCGEARMVYGELLESAGAEANPQLRALVYNDLAVLAALEGRFDEARHGWRSAVKADQGCLPARLNDALVAADLDRSDRGRVGFHAMPAPAPVPSMPADRDAERPPSDAGSPIKVAILSFLFNWPSTGGGNMHTAGLAQFLARAGYEVRHYYARYPQWGIGRVADELISTSEAIVFDEASWNVAEIQARYRRAVDELRPDHVVITDAWNMKPLLADAVRDYPHLLVYQAQENLCPLNNLRLLAATPTRVEQCTRNQLATPDVCCRCLADRGGQSGALHRAERELAGVGTPEYDRTLRRSLQEAEAVLVLNPLTAAMLEPYSACVRIVPWGLDPARFPWPRPEPERAHDSPTRLFMAAVASEFIKGFHVAHEACRILRQTRSDFELVVTFDPPGAGRLDEFTSSIGWCSQSELPRHYRESDIVLVPTIAQDALSITSVEAMASGVPVIASRIGGIPYSVTDGVHGLLFNAGEPADLARQIARLLDDPSLRRRMGLAGRKRFEDEFVWGDVIDRFFRPLFGNCPVAVNEGSRGSEVA